MLVDGDGDATVVIVLFEVVYKYFMIVCQLKPSTCNS